MESQQALLEEIAQLRAEVAASEAARKSEEAARKSAEAGRVAAVEALAQAEEKASRDATLNLLSLLSLVERSSQWKSVVEKALVEHATLKEKAFPEWLLPELSPGLLEGLCAAVRDLQPLPDNVAETGEDTPGRVHFLVRRFLSAVQSALPQPSRWEISHEPRRLSSGNDSNVPDWVLHDPRDDPSWLSAIILEAKAVQRAGTSVEALLREGYVSVTRFSARALQAQLAAFPDAASYGVLTLLTNGRDMQARYFTLELRGSCAMCMHKTPLLPLFAAPGQASAVEGVQLLARALLASPQQISGTLPLLPTHVSLCADAEQQEERVELGRRLGVGGWCDVFEVVSQDGTPPAALKVLRRRANPEQDGAAQRQLRTEAEVLRTLSACDFLPRLLRSSLSGDPPSLLLSPAGVPLPDYLGSLGSPSELTAAVEKLAHHVLCALCCAHRCGVLHNDLRPSNIVAVPASAGGALSFFLIDWGLCTKFECEIDGVVGYAPCACSDALRASVRGVSWSPTRSTDVECLAYACATVMHSVPASSVPPWARLEDLVRLHQCAPQTPPMTTLLRAREDWLTEQVAASLPRKVLRVAIGLKVLDAGGVAPEDGDYNLPGE